MASLVSVFGSAILPVLAITLAGYILGRTADVEVGPLNTVTLYVLLPALILHSILSTDIVGSTALRLVTAMLLFTFSMLAIAAVVGRLLGESGQQLSALLLGGSFPNSGNFGIPVATFAFATVGRNVAVLFVVVQNVLIYTLGVYVVARGSGDAWRGATRRVVTLPAVHAVVLALAVRWAGLVPPMEGTTMQTLRLVGDASIPLFLVILGLQLARAEPTAAIRRTTPTVGLKLLVAPVVGLAVALGIGLAPTRVARSFVLLCAGPIAVSPLVLFVEFGSDRTEGLTGAEYLGTAVFVTTLASVVVVTGMIVLLQSGVLL